MTAFWMAFCSSFMTFVNIVSFPFLFSDTFALTFATLCRKYVGLAMKISASAFCRACNRFKEESNQWYWNRGCRWVWWRESRWSTYATRCWSLTRTCCVSCASGTGTLTWFTGRSFHCIDSFLTGCRKTLIAKCAPKARSGRVQFQKPMTRSDFSFTQPRTDRNKFRVNNHL